jgi:hypothetical protein
MKVRILHKFHDRVDFMKVYLVGETVTFDDARAESLISRGLVENAEEVVETDEAEAPAEEETKAEELVEVSEVDETEGGEEAKTEEVAEAPAEESPKAVKPVVAKRKSQKDN